MYPPSFEARAAMDYLMESKPLDENKAPDVEVSDISSSDNRSMHSRYSSLSSTVRSSDFEDPFQVDQFEIDSTVSKDELLDHTSQQADDECSLQSPQLQTMERFNESFGYRIPSYVFSSNKSGTQMDWSVTSTESLFSIHIGSASFTQEQFSWLVKSGEQNDELYKNLGLQDPYFEDFHGSEDEVFSIKPGASPLESDSSIAGIAHTTIESPTNETGFEPDKGDQEMDHNSNPTLCSLDEQARHSVRCSDASGQSFAFPLLVEDEDRGNLEKSGVNHEEKPAQPAQKQPQPQPTQWSSPKADKVQTSAPELAQSSSWYSSCFACCSCRS